MSMVHQKATKKPTVSMILASGSPRRADLLAELVEGFTVVVPSVQEIESHPKGAIGLVLENARIKCDAIVHSFPDQYVLSADTVVALDNMVLGKPTDLDEAGGMLRRLSGRSHEVHTGLQIKNIAQKFNYSEVVTSKVTFKKISQPDITNYFKVVDPLDKAGAYALQTKPELIIDSFEGSRTNVIGLPLECLRKVIEQILIS